MTLQNKKIFTLILFLIIGFACLAQDIDMPPEPNTLASGPPPPVGLPIDGGICIAMFFALIYGVKKTINSN